MALQILGLLLGGQVEAAAGEGIDVLKDGVLVLPVDEVLRGNAVAIALNLRPDHDQLVRLGIGHGREQRGVDHGKNGGGGANAEGKRDDSGKGEDRGLTQLAQRVLRFRKIVDIKSPLCSGPDYSVLDYSVLDYSVLDYSVLRACIGSTVAARRAGRAAASATITAVKSTAAVRVNGSKVVTP